MSPTLHPQIPRLSGGRLPWPTTLLAAACLITAAATATAQGEWQPLAETPDGAIWAWRRGSVALHTVQGQPGRAFTVQRSAGGFAAVYAAGVAHTDCTAPVGHVHLYTLHSALVEKTPYRRGDNSVAAALAAVLCRQAVAQ